MKWLLAVLIIMCPSVIAQPQQQTIRCAEGYCVVPIEVIKVLIAQAEMNCGPTR